MVHKAVTYCLLVCARYPMSSESVRVALDSARQRPLRALDCYRSIWRSIPRHQR